MLEMNTKTARFLSRMGARGALGQAVYDYLSGGGDAFVLSADLAVASGFERVMKEYPDSFVNAGIAEQNLIGMAAGLARTGVPSIATTWAMFASVRAADQVRNFMGYMGANVKLIGMDSGFVQSRFSYSHSNPPDIALMRSIPNITVLSPCDGTEVYKAVYTALNTNGPFYIRLTGDGMLPIVYKNPSADFDMSRALVLKEGSDAVIIACGSIVYNALKAAEILEEKGISVSVVDMRVLAPLDTELLGKISEHKLIVTAEEHLINNGLGSAVAQYYADKKVRPRQIMLGVDNSYPAPGNEKYTRETAGLQPEQIAQRITDELEVDKSAEN